MELSLPFMKKKEQTVIPGKGFVPIDRVREMASRGFSEPEIIDVLRREGFSAEEIDKALTQALRIGVTGEEPKMPWPPLSMDQFMEQTQQLQQAQQQMQQAQNPQQMPQVAMPQEAPQQYPSGLPTLQSLEKSEGGAGPEQSMPQLPETSLPEDYYSQAYPTEDYIDYFVQQRTSDFESKIKNLEDDFKEIKKKLDEISTQSKTVMQVRNPDEQRVLIAKLDSFRELVNDVDTRVSGLERAFKETLPALIESVRALTDLVQRLKKEG